MQKEINPKKARAVVVTIALVLAANFAISHAESILVSNLSLLRSEFTTALLGGFEKPTSNDGFAADATIYQPAPRPSGSFAADATIYQPAPRPSKSFAADATIYQPAPRPSGSFAADATIYQPAPRPSRSFAADATIYQPAPRPS